MKKLILTSCLLLINPLAMSATDPSLPTGVYALTSLDLNASVQDLIPFLDMTKKAKIIALGESVHTDGSYHKLNTRLAKALIEQQGLRIVLLETPRLMARGVQNYVSTCDSNPPLLDSLQTILPQFSSVEMASFLIWLRAFNCSHPGDQVTFMGMDIQSPGLDELALEKFVISHAQSLVGRLSDLKICVPDAQDIWAYQGPATDSEMKKCLDFLTDLEPYISKQDPQTRFELDLSTTALHYNAGYVLYRVDDLTAESWRDEGMATMIRKVIEHSPGKKTAIIAHLEHVGRGFEQVNKYANKAMGTFLSEWYGHDYFVSTTLSSKPATAAWWIGTYVPGPTSFEAELHGLNRGGLLINVNQNALVPATASVQLGGYLGVVMSRHFDSVAYIDIGQPMTNYPGIQYPPMASTIGPEEQDYAFGSCSRDWSLANQGLSLGGQGFSASCDPNAESGAGAVLLQANSPHESQGGVVICESAHNYFGRAVVTGRLRTENVANGTAGLFALVNDSMGNTTRSNTPQAISGTTGWTDYQISIEIPANADGGVVCFGVSLSGDGAVGVEKLSIIPGG